MRFIFLAFSLSLFGCRIEAVPDDSQDVVAIPVVSDLTWRLHEEMGSLAYVSWTQSADALVHVEYSFDDGIWASSPTFMARAGAQEQLIAGIPFEMTAQWRVVPDGGESVDGEPIATGELPDLPLGTVTVSDPTAWSPGANYLLTSINRKSGGWTDGEYWTFILDRQARVIWAHAAPEHHWTLFAQVSVTKDYFMWDEATYWSDWDDGEGSTVHKAWLDEEIEQVSTPGLHHAFVQLPDETLVWGSQYDDRTEALVERGPADIESSILWTCQDNWPGSGGDCESNGLFYVEATDSFLYSFYTNNSIVEVDHQTGASLWWAGEVPNGYSFDPESSQYAWQHGITYTEAGTLLVSSEYTPDGERDPETWLLEYDVDSANQTLHYLWGNSSGDYASTNGDAWRLANGDTLHVVGAAAVLREVDPAGTDVWRVQFDGTRLLGRGEFIEDLYTLVKPRE